MISIPMPKKVASPSSLYIKNVDRHICSGACQIILRYGNTSIIRWTSTDIRFTISPTELSFLVLRGINKDFL